MCMAYGFMKQSFRTYVKWNVMKCHNINVKYTMCVCRDVKGTRKRSIFAFLRKCLAYWIFPSHFFLCSLYSTLVSPSPLPSASFTVLYLPHLAHISVMSYTTAICVCVCKANISGKLQLAIWLWKYQYHAFGMENRDKNVGNMGGSMEVTEDDRSLCVREYGLYSLHIHKVFKLQPLLLENMFEHVFVPATSCWVLN